MSVKPSSPKIFFSKLIDPAALAHTKYFPVRRVNVVFHNLPARLEASLAEPGTRTSGHAATSNSVSTSATIFAVGNEGLPLFMLGLQPSIFNSTFQSVLFFYAGMEISPASPGSKRRRWSDAREAEATRAVTSLLSCCMTIWR